MSYALPHLPWLRAFEAAARKQSFTGAAKELHVSPAAISLQIKSLEQHLGLQLFERLARGVVLTEMGRAYLPSVRKAFDELSMSTTGLFGSKGRQTVTVRCTAAFAVLWLAPRLPQFMQAHPTIELRLFTSVWADGLGADQADLDIRFGDGRWPGHDIRLLRHEPSVPVCSPQWLRKARRKEVLSALARQHLIHIMGCEDLWTRWFQSHGDAALDSQRGVQVDTSLTALELASAGSGFAIVLRSFAQPYLASGRLVAPFAGELPIEQAHYLLLPERDTRPSAAVLLFCEWLLEQAGAKGNS